ncbi:MAG TPA: phosphotransferase [Anaerolineae bacterium]|nr:phosphotransferase [Anaerolineae bacterium]
MYLGTKPSILRPGFLYAEWQLRRVHAPFTSEITQNILAQYGLTLTRAPQCTPGGQGRSHSAVVYTNQGKKFFKQYKKSLTRSAIEHEHSILKYLDKVNFLAAPRLVATQAGTTVVHHEGAYYVLFDFIEDGFQYYKYVMLPSQTKRFVIMAGKLLAQLHQVLTDFTPAGSNPNGFISRTGERWHELDWYLDKLRENVKAPLPQMHTLTDRAPDLERALCALDQHLRELNLPRTTIHGDYGPHNLLFRKNAPVVILDFEIARLDWRALDMVNALWRIGKDKPFRARRDRIEWFFDAYNSVTPLTRNEQRALPQLWKFSHVRRVISNWWEYSRTCDEFNRTKAFRHLQLYDWIDAYPSYLQFEGMEQARL